MNEAKSLSKKVPAVLFAALLLGQICFTIYKAHHTGITHDEAYTYFHFGKDLHKALTSYINPNNNHVLNSVFICLVDKHFNFHDHFIRTHSVIFSMVFSISLAYIIHNTIRHNLLKIAVLAFVLLNWFVFDLSYLARGYSISLGAIYLATALILRLLSNNIKYKTFFWLPALIIIAMNFLALGSMVSSIFMLSAVNVIFVLLYSHRVFCDNPNKRSPVLFNLLCIPLATFALLFLLYKRLYTDILAARDKFGSVTWTTHLRQVLAESIVKPENRLALALYGVFVLLTVLALLFTIKGSYKQIKGSTRQNRLYSDASANFVLLITVATLSALFIHRVVLKLSVGYMRNGVFLVPLTLISSAILIDRLLGHLKKHRLVQAHIYGLYLLSVISLMLLNLPSKHAVLVHSWKTQSLSGPLVRKLKQIGPAKHWLIGLNYETRYLFWPLRYYKQQGYTCHVADPNAWDVAVLHKSEKLPNSLYLDENFFSEFDCCVLVNPKVAQELSHRPEDTSPYEQLLK